MFFLIGFDSTNSLAVAVLAVVETISDSDSLTPLSPNLLLTMKSKIVMAPPGNFTDADMYSRRRWR